MPTEAEAKLLFELLTNCDVKLESSPDGNRLYWSGSQRIVSDGTKLKPFAELSKAIIAFTQQLYT